MIYRMKLQNKPFKQIEGGSKKIEIRLNDEKRSLFNVNDYIEITNISTLEIMFVKITNLYHFESFEMLFNHFDNSILGSSCYENLYNYYSKEDETLYGVLGIEIETLPKFNQIIHNENNLTLMDVNKIVRRSKLIVENSKGEILICHMGTKYFLIGGHIDNDESDEQCLTREVYEESGVKIKFKNILPIASSNYINKDYNNITYINTNYYFIKYDLIPDIKNQNLTQEEKNKNFNLIYIPKSEVLVFLEKNRKISQENGTLSDTIMAIKVYLNLQK